MQQTHMHIHTQAGHHPSRVFFSVDNPFMQLVGSDVNSAGRASGESGEKDGVLGSTRPLWFPWRPLPQEIFKTIPGHENSGKAFVYISIFGCASSLCHVKCRKPILFVHTSRERTV